MWIQCLNRREYYSDFLQLNNECVLYIVRYRKVWLSVLLIGSQT
jgi:hypothetical protein